ncbi:MULTISPECIES: phage tail protein [unclassified Pseudomonas]|uniref:phage tail protein n=1 Tax=unclassified Pseudomonas TaxID=196821 RepID=UPI000D3A89FB|nr:MULTISPECIES: phage tail protein [unclassified Pseudomonas]RAU43428.1 phage tail protein [Pseudomonas sp. RIT 409]RAU50036.1 phage tail protein [Pseudomonas sp. RIT 412]
MAVETFTWCPRIEPTSAPGYRVRSSKFGSGYEQVVGDGINNREDSWPLTFVVNETVARQIKAFLDRHGNFKSFFWTPPLGELGFWRATAPAITPNGAGVYTLTTTFTQSYLP